MVVADAGTVRPGWHEANQRYLSAALAELRSVLEHPSDSGVPEPREREGEDPETAQLAASMPAPPALEQLARAFGLSRFERDVVLLCAGIELEATFASLCGAAHGDPERGHPTFGLALATLPGAHWSALAPTSALRHWRLVELRPGDTLTGSPLRIDERVLHHLTGVQHLDENLVGFVQAVEAGGGPPVPSHREVAERVAEVWGRTGGGGLPVIQLTGDEGAGKRAIALAACRRIGHDLYRMPASVLPSGAHEFDALLRLWTRESVLSGGVLLLDAEEHGAGDPARDALLRRFAEELGRPLIVASRERLDIVHRPTVAFEVSRPTRAEQHAVWVETLGPRAGRLNGQIDRLTAQFDLDAPAIRAAGLRAVGGSHEEDEVSGDVLWGACRVQARQRLEGHARCLEPTATWDDLVLPASQLASLHAIEMHVRHRIQVHETWGFAARSNRGLGITALFSGPSGTGKTLAADVLAHALELDLYHVDLSAVVSKYIGETEKNLRRVFDAAESGGAVLLFDEADALFGKRSEVRDSHDRYANLEVSYLLQRMEAYRGLAILTTNLKSALDEAFERRLRFRVAFPFPDATQRAAIWDRIFPDETDTEGLDPEKLARLNATGGTIRNVALHAAFLAADEGAPVRMVHLRDAARTVYAQLERSLTDGETRGWA